MNNIKALIPADLDGHQFTEKANRCTDDTISLALHTALTHLENSNTYVRMLFVDFSLAFNSINSNKLVNKLLSLGLDTHLCKWIKDFLTNRPQHVRLGNLISSTTILNTGTPQAVFLVRCSTHSSHITVLPLMTQTPYSSLQMTQLWWGW